MAKHYWPSPLVRQASRKFRPFSSGSRQGQDCRSASSLWRARHNRKNCLFFGDTEAGERSAIIYTVIESCLRHGIDPYTYLRDVLTRQLNMTNRQIPEVTLRAWAKPPAIVPAKAS